MQHRRHRHRRGHAARRRLSRLVGRADRRPRRAGAARAFRHLRLPLPSRRQLPRCPPLPDLPAKIAAPPFPRLAPRPSRRARGARRTPACSMTTAAARCANCRSPSPPRRAAWPSARISAATRPRARIARISSARSRATCRSSRCSTSSRRSASRGHSVIIANACASGANAIGHAADLIATGAAECVLAGGFEALTELVFVGFDCLQATTHRALPPLRSQPLRPADRRGRGVSRARIAEHAGARRDPLCHLTGYGHTTDFFHLTQPQARRRRAGRGHARRRATQAGIAPGADRLHQRARHRDAGQRRRRGARPTPTFLGDALGATRISSTKAAIGHTLGAAGAIEALFAIEALRTGELPPQLNLQNADPGNRPGARSARAKRAAICSTS